MTSLHGYQRAWLAADAVAGATLLVIAVPEQLATSRLAGMPPITGLYAFVAGTVLFALLGANPKLSSGADSTIAPLFAAALSRYAPTTTTRYAELVSLLAVVSGAIVMAVGLLRLGWIADFMSTPIVTGFLAGVAVIIVVHQLPDLLGIPAVSGTTIERLDHLVRHLSSANGWTLGIGLGVLVVVIASEKLSRRFPGALVALAASTGIVAAAHLAHHGVAVLGSLGRTTPHLGPSGVSFKALGEVLPVAAVVALVICSQTAATSRAFGEVADASDADRDFIGVGAGSVAAGLIGSFAVDASPPRTAAVDHAGGRTQAGALMAACVVGAVILLGAALKDVPVATLGAILVLVAGRIVRVHDLVAIARFDWFELSLSLLTLLTVAFVGVEQGIGLAVGLAIVDRTRRSARPKLYVLGRIPGSTSWEPLGHHEHPEQVPGVVAVLFGAPIYFANAGWFRLQVKKALAEAPVPAKLLVLNAAGTGDIDFTGTRTLGHLIAELRKAGVDVAVARAIEAVPRNLQRSGLLETIGPDHVFHTVDEAVLALAPNVVTLPEKKG